MSKAEFARTLVAGDGHGVYWWDFETRSIQGARELVPWPITWILSFHFKHIHVPSTKPRIQDITSRLYDWGRRILWRAHFEKAEEYDKLYNPELVGIDEQYAFLRSKIRSDKSGPPHEVLDGCIAGVKNMVLDTCMEALNSYRPELWSNTCGLVQLGFKLLRSSGFKAIKTDKDGGFALTTTEEWMAARSQAVQTHHYKKVAVTEGFELEFIDSYKHVCRQLADTYPKNHRHAVYSALTRDSYMIGIRGFYSRLLFTVKTHKPEGEVVTRNVHGSGDNPFRPLMRLIVSIIKKKTSKFEHLIRDSSHLSSILAKTVLGDGENQRLYKADIKDFFMSGKHSRLLELVSSAPDPSIRAEFVDGVDFLLGSQFLKLPEFPNSAFQVVVGSGMGLLSSDEISSYCFAELVERHVLTDSYKQRYGLKLWVRFKDDIFFVLDSEHDTRVAFCHEVKRLSECFLIKFETVSTSTVDMLDMVIFKGKRFAASGKLDTGAFVKTTHQGTSLSERSGHHPSVHVAWPESRMAHFTRICNSREGILSAQVAFFRKLVHDCPSIQ